MPQQVFQDHARIQRYFRVFITARVQLSESGDHIFRPKDVPFHDRENDLFAGC